MTLFAITVTVAAVIASLVYIATLTLAQNVTKGMQQVEIRQKSLTTSEERSSYSGYVG